MRAFSPARRIALAASMLALLALSAPVGAQAAPSKRERPPHVVTGRALHVVGGSALLTGTVKPNGKPTTWYFQYGLTTAYTNQSPPQTLTGTAATVRVGQPVSGLLAGTLYHYRLVATSVAGTGLGKDRFFGAKGHKLKFEVPKALTAVYGSPFVFSGTLTGFGSPNHRIALQATPFPFLEAFASIGTPGITDRFGLFSFRLGNLTTSSKLRLYTFDPRPVYSPVVSLNVAVRVVLHARTSPHSGLARLFGTVTPAIHSGTVFFQQEQAIRPTLRREATSRFVTRFVTGLKHGNRKSSRFSMIVKVHRTGTYRAFVKVRPGPLVSGTSTRTYYLHAAPKTKK